MGEAKEEAPESVMKMLNEFLVGCDPEFVAIAGDGRQMNLHHFFPNNREIGYDHHGRVGEFRPEPTKGTYALVKKLYRLINSPEIKYVNAAKLRAGATAFSDSLGGHVHFGIPVPVPEYFRDPPDVKITALDTVTRTLEHLDILPQQESATRRRGGYGHFGDVRDSGGHLEYRTMASWLLSPAVAFLCLTAAKIACCDSEATREILGKVTSFEGLAEWFRRYKTKDTNARRVVDRVVPLSHKAVQVPPDVDFRENWREIGI